MCVMTMIIVMLLRSFEENALVLSCPYGLINPADGLNLMHIIEQQSVVAQVGFGHKFEITQISENLQS